MSINNKSTIEQLENDYWPNIDPNDSSSLVRICHELRKKAIQDFEIEDLRILIGQNIGISYLIPMAINQLEDNILAEGDYYPGDLLYSVLSSSQQYWINHLKEFNKLKLIYLQNQNNIENEELTWEIRKKLKKAFADFCAYIPE